MNYHMLKGSIVLNYEGKTESIAKDDPRFERIIQCVRENRLDDIQDIVEEVNRLFTAKGIDLIDGIIYVNNQPLPHELSDRIIAYKEENLPFDSLLKFWENLKENPSFNARQMLFKFLEHNGHPLTQDGCFIAYRGCTDDFKDRRTGKFDNSPGSICEMPRQLVDDNPNNTCSDGLHVASYAYAYNWGENNKTIEVKINPKDVVCVPTDYQNTKMRVCKFEVVQECKAEREETLYIDDHNDCDDDMCSNCGDSYQLDIYCSTCGCEMEKD